MRHGELKVNDIVVAEASIVRWPLVEKPEGSTGNKGARYRRREWDKWRVEFKLESVWFIYAGSKHTAAPTGVREDVSI